MLSLIITLLARVVKGRFSLKSSCGKRRDCSFWTHAKNRRAQSPTVFTQFNSVQLTNGSGHSALASFLTRHGVDALICGGIGGGAQMALAEAGIKLYGGVSGEADEAVNALLAGTLGYNPDVHCSHHDHEHGEGGHTCDEHGCGHHGCH